jgi:hypothetical protein
VQTRLSLDHRIPYIVAEKAKPCGNAP